MTGKTASYDVGGITLERPFKIRRLGHFALWQSDLDMARRLYVDLLGFRETDTIERNGKAVALFTSHGTDHHSLAAIHPSTAEGVRKAHYENGVIVNQISFQVGALEEVANAYDYFAQRQVTISRLGRDFPGSNWALYVLDPDGHRIEIYYGMEQIGWDRRSKPRAAYIDAVRQGFQLPQPAEMTEITNAERNGIDLVSGFRPTEALPHDFDVGGIMLPRPFKPTKIGPVSLFVADVDRSERFYTELFGLAKTEEVIWRGQRCVYLRCGTDHHCLALVPMAPRRARAQSVIDADEHRRRGRDLPAAEGCGGLSAREGPALHRHDPVRAASWHRLCRPRHRPGRALHRALSRHGAARLGRTAAPGGATAARRCALAADARGRRRRLYRPGAARANGIAARWGSGPVG
jgi:catechol-2,3-dioxygenase